MEEILTRQGLCEQVVTSKESTPCDTTLKQIKLEIDSEIDEFTDFTKLIPEPIIYRSAAQRVFAIAEILEQIVGYVAETDWDEFAQLGEHTRSSRQLDPVIFALAGCENISKFSQNMVNKSLHILRKVWLWTDADTCKLWKYQIPVLIPWTEQPGKPDDIFSFNNRPRINYPFLSWLSSRLCLAFEPKRRCATAKIPYRKFFDECTFPNGFFSNPPTESVMIIINLADHFYPGLRKARNTESNVFFCERIYDQYDTKGEKQNMSYVLLIRNQTGILVHDICCQLSAFIGLGRETHITDWVKSVQVGTWKRVHRPARLPNKLWDTLTFTNSGLMSFVGDTHGPYGQALRRHEYGIKWGNYTVSKEIDAT
ncbi:hypothetical protein ABW20_dc0107645 [Dactylellina cionopaga]|nr:hypothetical protein ABW20_dc0107645 [Dactylellina cionopaga]